MTTDALTAWLAREAAKGDAAEAGHTRNPPGREPPGSRSADVAQWSAALEAGYLERVGPYCLGPSDLYDDTDEILLEPTEDPHEWISSETGALVDDRDIPVTWRYRLTESGAQAIRRARLEAAWSWEVPTEPGPYWLWEPDLSPRPVPVALHRLPGTTVGADVRRFDTGRSVSGVCIDAARWHAWQGEPPEVPGAE